MNNRVKRILLPLCAAVVVCAAVWVPQRRLQLKNADLYLKPMLADAEILSSTLGEITHNDDGLVLPDLEAAEADLERLMTSARSAGKAFSSEIDGYADFVMLLGHCQNRVRVMREAVGQGEFLFPEEVLFLHTLKQSLASLAQDLEGETGARPFSKAVTVFTETMRNL